MSVFGTDGSPTWVSEIYSIEPEREGIVVRDMAAAEAVAELMAYLDGRGAFDDGGGERFFGRGEAAWRCGESAGMPGAIWVLGGDAGW